MLSKSVLSIELAVDIEVDLTLLRELGVGCLLCLVGFEAAITARSSAFTKAGTVVTSTLSVCSA